MASLKGRGILARVGCLAVSVWVWVVGARCGAFRAVIWGALVCVRGCGDWRALGAFRVGVRPLARGVRLGTLGAVHMVAQ